MSARILTKFSSQSPGSLDSSIPKTLILSENEKPRAEISSEITCEEPINKIDVLSRLHFKPLMEAKSASMFFRFNRFWWVKTVATLVLSANPSVLSVSVHDS
jgi:hypothetical protein